MHFKFNPSLSYQNEAISAVVNLFKGQENIQSEFSTIEKTAFNTYKKGFGNKLTLSFEELKNNFRKIQDDNELLEVNDKLESLDFNIEMETGTGKTYVYLRTILELNKNYNFNKFIIVVPSLAIKEGVKKTLEITEDHFKTLYNNVNYSYFVYDSNDLIKLKDFQEDKEIQIMIINIQSFNKHELNLINQRKENGVLPIDLIRSTNPIMIIDEPQSSAKTINSQEAIASFEPMCTFQYSATPIQSKKNANNVENLIYKLDAVEAYKKRLVKKIEVDAFESADYYNKAYINLISTKLSNKGKITAELRLAQLTNKGIYLKNVNVKKGDNLSVKKLGNREIYNNYIVKDISTEEGNEYVSFEDPITDVLKIDLPINDINQDFVKKEQIRETIKSHLDKELKLKDKNIKVLSLFFIDEVKNYRWYDNKKPQKGKYAEFFEREYQKIIKENSKYQDLPDYIKNIPVSEVHDGYFSIDKGVEADTSGKTQNDNSTYEKIMKDKEGLLDPKDKLRFIFSHSALKEGWDNPNVFQICTLIESQSDLSKRQKIGRGLRLCVDGEGNRIYDDNINILTVLANESYEHFAQSLQNEMEEDGIKFSSIHKHIFTKIEHDGRKLSKFDSEKIFKSLLDEGYIDKKGKIRAKWGIDFINNEIKVPGEYDVIKNEIIEQVNPHAPEVNCASKKNKVNIEINEEIYENEDFKKFWDKIKYKTIYSISLNSEELIKNCIKKINQKTKNIEAPKLIHSLTEVKDINNKINGLSKFKRTRSVEKDEALVQETDIIRILEEHTYLTRKTIVQILTQSNSLKYFEINPSMYINTVLTIIEDVKNHMLIDGIKYIKTDDYYKQSLFKENELIGYLNDDIIKSTKSLYNFVKYDHHSNTEKSFAEDLEVCDYVKLFVKLPQWFKINTPLGTYNPDWAIFCEMGDCKEEKLYFIVETKGTLKEKYLRETENDKIVCGKKHFEAIDGNVIFDKAIIWDDFIIKYAYEK